METARTMGRGSKPIGVVAVAGFVILFSLYVLFLTITIVAFTDFSKVDRLYFLMLILVGIGTFAIGIYLSKNLYELKAWAKNTTIILLALLFLSSVGSAITGNLPAILLTLLSMLFIIYLINPSVSKHFS
jgi:hypothetical protein